MLTFSILAETRAMVEHQILVHYCTRVDPVFWESIWVHVSCIDFVLYENIFCHMKGSWAAAKKCEDHHGNFCDLSLNCSNSKVYAFIYKIYTHNYLIKHNLCRLGWQTRVGYMNSKPKHLSI